MGRENWFQILETREQGIQNVQVHDCNAAQTPRASSLIVSFWVRLLAEERRLL